MSKPKEDRVWWSPAECGEDIGVSGKVILDWCAAGRLRVKWFGDRTPRVHIDWWNAFKEQAPEAKTDEEQAAPAPAA